MVHHTAIASSQHEVQRAIVERSHARRYPESKLHSHIAYHFLIGRDGTIVKNRKLTERSGHTRNQDINLDSIAVVLAGNFEIEEPSRAQLASLRRTVRELRLAYPDIEIIGHRDASPTSCPGRNLEKLLPTL